MPNRNDPVSDRVCWTSGTRRFRRTTSVARWGTRRCQQHRQTFRGRKADEAARQGGAERLDQDKPRLVNVAPVTKFSASAASQHPCSRTACRNENGLRHAWGTRRRPGRQNVGDQSFVLPRTLPCKRGYGDIGRFFRTGPWKNARAAHSSSLTPPVAPSRAWKRQPTNRNRCSRAGRWSVTAVRQPPMAPKRRLFLCVQKSDAQPACRLRVRQAGLRLAPPPAPCRPRRSIRI